MIILLTSTYVKTSAQSPYAMFGDNSKMLEAKSEAIPSICRIGMQSFSGASFYADLDLNKCLATLCDEEGNVLCQDSISENSKAMFTTIDPHAENYYHISPYAYCGGNPVNAIDPDGRDYWSTNDSCQILQFLNAIGSGNTQFEFSGWSHATDAEFCGNLVYNDESHIPLTIYHTMKVFVKKGGRLHRLHRIGTADKNLNIFKR